jgi:hypothetical protein
MNPPQSPTVEEALAVVDIVIESPEGSESPAYNPPAKARTIASSSNPGKRGYKQGVVAEAD